MPAIKNFILVYIISRIRIFLPCNNFYSIFNIFLFDFGKLFLNALCNSARLFTNTYVPLEYILSLKILPIILRQEKEQQLLKKIYISSLVSILHEFIHQFQ